MRGGRRARDGVDDLGARAAVVEQRRARSGRRVLIEVKHRIVGVVAGEGIAGPVSEIRREGCTGEVLVNLPAHAGRLQHFGEGLPDEVRIVDAEAVVGDRSGAEAVGAAGAQVVHVADAARPQVACDSGWSAP